MEELMKTLRTWGAPAAAVAFLVLWWVGEAGRMGPWPGLPTWNGTIPLLMVTAAIAVAVWKPYLSLGIIGALLVGQLVLLIPSMYANHWAIYLGSFIALGFIQWTGNRSERITASISNGVFLVLMTVLIMAGRYGNGVGWYTIPEGEMINQQGGPMMARLMFSLWVGAILLAIAAGAAIAGRNLSLYEEREGLFKEHGLANEALAQTEIDLLLEQERSRISRDLHDVLAHSLAVIAAQSDGARYIGASHPKAVATALEHIATSARGALIDAQRVIEGVDNSETHSHPRLTDVKELLRRSQQGSLKIAHSETGTATELTPGAELAVFRIVQECLTNALKHGGRGTSALVHYDWNGPGLTLHISSDMPKEKGPTVDTGGGTRTGRGIAGMRERAYLAGGWLAAGSDASSFRITAFLPYGLPEDSVFRDPTVSATAAKEAGSGLPLRVGAKTQTVGSDHG